MVGAPGTNLFHNALCAFAVQSTLICIQSIILSICLLFRILELFVECALDIAVLFVLISLVHNRERSALNNGICMAIVPLDLTKQVLIVARSGWCRCT